MSQADLGDNAPVLIHNYQPKLIESVLLHDLEARLARFCDGVSQVPDFDADRVDRDCRTRLNVKEKPGHLRRTSRVRI
jgi:hypothetical protein